ncbi:hypothetical protein MMC28_001561 [Mycoblastus sanguinarius]|nr:hypothetical protein [Mycoblastus sanguinarius]
MSSPTTSDEDAQDRRLSITTEPTFPNSSDSKVQAAWNSVKTNFKARTSVPDLRRWWSSTSSNARDDQRWPEDEEQSLFCESLLVLMQRSGRFDYLDFTDRKKEKQTLQRGEGQETTAGRSKRFSFTSR